MPEPSVADDTAAEAKRLLHEDQVSPTVERALKRLDGKRWVLYHAQDYLLGCLQILESAHLLRDPQAEHEAEERLRQSRRAFGDARTSREEAYRELVLRVVGWSNIPGAVERLHLIDEARDEDEYRALTRRFESDELPKLVEEWRAKRAATAEAAIQRVARLLDPKRKTVSMQALREALNPNPEGN